MAIQSARIKLLNEAEPRASARYVLYWMQAAQRAHGNHALEYAVEKANEHGLPLVCCFGLTDDYPEANARHYQFMLEGLQEAAREFSERDILFVIRRGEPDGVALALSEEAALVICDRGYLKPQKLWRRRLAEQAKCPVVQVEGEVVMPVETASPKHEYAARTLRPKITRIRDEFLVPLAPRRLQRKGDGIRLESDFSLDDVPALVASLKIDQGVKGVKRFKGGYGEARRRLRKFLAGPFERYGHDRNKPEAEAASHMSPYLHFGQISPVEMALAVSKAKAGGMEDKAAYLEELIVRRELAMNHVFYEERYDSYESVPQWARATLDKARGDKRPFLYTPEQLAAGETHDIFWNAAMKEMRETGFMHNHLRMYWGKKIIEWLPSPEEAFDTILRLNNRFFLDGRDANSFTNVAWLFGLHDRPWAPRPAFGNVRYLGQATLRKFDAKAYVKAVDALADAEKDG